MLYADGVITAPNVVLAGIVGSGKSSLAKSLYTCNLPFGRRVYVPGDPKANTPPSLRPSADARSHSGTAWPTGSTLGWGLSALTSPTSSGRHRVARRRDLIGALAEVVLARALTPLEHTVIDTALTATVRRTPCRFCRWSLTASSPPPAIATDDWPRTAESSAALRRLVAGDLAGLFDGPSTVQFDPTLPMISLDLSRVTENSTLISALMTCCSAWMESALLDPAGGQRWVIYDEAWRLMSQPSLLRRMDAHWRLARHYGIANALIFHKLTDLENVGDSGSAMRSLANSLLANAETRIIYRQESDQLGVTAKTLGLTTTERKLLPSLGVGQGLWRIKERSFVVQQQLHPAELELFDTSARASGLAPGGSTL